jgi:hypothetical protein
MGQSNTRHEYFYNWQRTLTINLLYLLPTLHLHLVQELKGVQYLFWGRHKMLVHSNSYIAGEEYDINEVWKWNSVTNMGQSNTRHELLWTNILWRPQNRYCTPFSSCTKWRCSVGNKYNKFIVSVLLQLQVECTFFCNNQRRARTHAILVIGLYELLGNPTT